MAIKDKKISPRARSMRSALVIGAVVGVSALSACSQVPDALNPAEWYRGTVDLFSGDKKVEQAEDKGSGLQADRGKAPPGADKEFPNLASVDRQARARDNAGGGLIADPDRPKYAPAIARQGEAPASLPKAPEPAPVPEVAATMPPPAAAPTTPVTPAPTPKVAMAPPPTARIDQPATPMPVPSTPMTTTAEQKEAEARLSERLADIRRQAELIEKGPASRSLPDVPLDGGTIVVSAGGIQAEGAFAAADTPPTVSIPSGPGGPGGGAGVATGPSALPVPSNAVRVATILFSNGSAKLAATDKRILNGVSRLQKKQGGVIRVVGHASARTRNLAPIKRKMANFKVSIDRADVVAGELVRLGVPRGAILIAAVSDSEPQYYEFMPSGEAGNRRTEVYLGN